MDRCRTLLQTLQTSMTNAVVTSTFLDTLTATQVAVVAVRARLSELSTQIEVR